MTRKQAERIANRIIEATLKAAQPGVYWTAQPIHLDVSDRDALSEHGSLIVGCLPFGWGLRRLSATGTEVMVVRPSPEAPRGA